MKNALQRHCEVKTLRAHYDYALVQTQEWQNGHVTGTHPQPEILTHLTGTRPELNT